MIECPRCYAGVIHIDAHVTVEVTAADGPDLYPLQSGEELPAWAPEDPARCRECHLEGTVDTFVKAESAWYRGY